MMSSSSAVLDDVLAAVSQMTGCTPQMLHAESLFFADLGLGSIDVIVLGERLEQQFGRRLAFAEALAEFSRTGRDDVTLGELAAFVQFQLDTPPPA